MTDASLSQISGVSSRSGLPPFRDREPAAPDANVVIVADAGGGERAPARSSRSAWRRVLLPWLLPVGLIALWQLLCDHGIISTAIVPAPSDVWTAARQLAEQGELQHDILVSLRRVAIGFGAGASLGLVLGVIVGLSEVAHDLFDRSLQMIRTIPHLALVPLMILWFGIGEEPRVILVAMGSLFPVYINTVGGIRNVDPKLIELGGLMAWAAVSWCGRSCCRRLCSQSWSGSATR